MKSLKMRARAKAEGKGLESAQRVSGGEADPMSHSAEMVQASPEQVRFLEDRESVSRYTAKSKELALHPACDSKG